MLLDVEVEVLCSLRLLPPHHDNFIVVVGRGGGSVVGIVAVEEK